MRKTLFLLLFMLQSLCWAQQELVIEGPNDKVAPITLQVKSDFNQDKMLLTFTITGDDTKECNALCLLQEPAIFGNLEKYFKEREGKLRVSSYAKDQIDFMNLAEKTALEAFQITGGQLVEKPVFKTNQGFKSTVQKQILSLDDHSSVRFTVQVNEGAEEVRLDMHNPLALYVDEFGKYELAFIGKDVSATFNVVIDYCGPNECLIKQIHEYIAIFTQGEVALKGMKTDDHLGIGKMKSLLISEYNQIDISRFENTKCQQINDSLTTLKALINRINNFEATSSSGGGGGDSGLSGQAGAGATSDCNFKKVNEDLKEAVIKMNTYANDWMSATDSAVKQAKKVAFDGVVRETDAKVNALSPACRKKLNPSSLKNYEMAKKLIK